MSNKELADVMGVSPSMASRVRNGRRLPSTAVMMRLHGYFNIPESKLLAAHADGAEMFGRLVTQYAGRSV